MTKRLMISTMLAAAACGDSGSDAPSCQQAFTHYYESGCAYINLDTGEATPVGEMVSLCRQALAEAPSSCEDDVLDWILCTSEVPDNVTRNEQCDCSVEFEALYTCE
jgi:hypothetical protein